MQTIYYQEFQLQGNKYILATTDKGLAFVGSPNRGIEELQKFYPQAQLIERNKDLSVAAREVNEYLKGQRKTFDLTIDINGTPFQETVWKELQSIPYGATSNYTQIAKQIDRPKAVRAVGSAIGKNPVLMVIPCHRVLTKANTLGGYRGGLKMKQDLLTLEQSK